jgi:putative hydrolase of the HAD superfamily
MGSNFKAVIFDWGDTLMRDFPELEGPMYLWENNELIDGVKELLDVLAGRYLLVVATNAGVSDTTAMIKALERVNIKNYFQHFFSSAELGYNKPDRRFFTSISENISVAPQDCIMIGNLYEKDITGAKDAGMSTIFFNEKKIPGSFEKADHIVFKINEIIDILI